MFVYLECSTLWTLCQWTGPSQCLQYIILDLNSGIWRWSIMTAIYPYMTDLRITQSRYNLPDISQGFSNIMSGHEVLRLFHQFTLCYVQISRMWYIVNPLTPDRAITMSSIYYTWSKFQNLRWSIMTCQNQLWSTTITIWPYIPIWPTSGLQSWCNLPNVSQNFSNITSDDDVLQ